MMNRRAILVMGVLLPLLTGSALLILEYNVFMSKGLSERPTAEAEQRNTLGSAFRLAGKLSEVELRDAEYRRIIDLAVAREELAFAAQIAGSIQNAEIRDAAYEFIARSALRRSYLDSATELAERVGDPDRRNALYTAINEIRLDRVQKARVRTP